MSRYLIIDVEPAEYVDRIIEEYVGTVKRLAGLDALGYSIEVVARYEGRFIIRVHNELLKYARAAVAVMRDIDGSPVGLITVKVTGTRRRAVAIASSLRRIYA